MSRAAAAGGDCADCRWVVSQVCVHDAAVPADRNACTGEYVSCPADQTRWTVQESGGGQPLHVVDSYCHGGAGDGTVTAADLSAQARAYAERLTAPTPTLRSYPPDGATLVNLETYFAADAAPTVAGTVGGQGYQLRVQLTSTGHRWTFGDGASATTTDAGGPPPDGDVHHVYGRAGMVTVGVTASYGATYSVVTPYGTLGPFPVTGGPVRTVPAQMRLEVREAHAGLTQ